MDLKAAISSTKPAEELCEFCRGLTIETVTEEGHPHAPTLDIIRQNASFCRLCKWITELTWRSRFSNVDSVSEPPSPKEESLCGNYKLCLVKSGSSTYQNLVRLSTGHGTKYTTSLYFYRLEGAPAPPSCKVPARKLLTDTSSNHSFETAEAWLRDCDTNHDCRSFSLPPPSQSSPSQQPLPGRLVDLRDFSASSPTARLVTTDSLPDSVTSRPGGFYSTLSYCWGTAPFHTTTAANLSRSLLVSIPFGGGSIPQTFRDAFTITTRLGTPFIWIDALCIVQDSLRDWQTESAKMPYVYSRARFTISADSSFDASGGCFNTSLALPRQHSLPNNPLTIPPPPTTTTTRRADGGGRGRGEGEGKEEEGGEEGEGGGEGGGIMIRPPSSTPLFLYHQPSSLFEVPSPLSIHYGPLSSRGWTFQERILSARILHYSSEQLFWECRREFGAEDGTHHWPGCARTLPDSVTGLARRTGHGQHQHPPGGSLTFEWCREVVEVYSERKWTKAGDKLPALAGVARVYAREFDEEGGLKSGREGYVAGVWVVKPAAPVGNRPLGLVEREHPKGGLGGGIMAGVEVGYGLAWRRRGVGLEEGERPDLIRQREEERRLRGGLDVTFGGNTEKHKNTTTTGETTKPVLVAAASCGKRNNTKNNTFSWISVDGPVEYPESLYIPGYLQDPPPLEVVGWHVELENPLDDFGAVGECSITLRGLLKSGKMAYKDCGKGHKYWVVIAERPAGLGIMEVGKVTIDEEDPTKQPHEMDVWCLPVLKRNESELQALVLSRINGSDGRERYRRLGLMTARFEWRIKGEGFPCICTLCHPNMYWDALIDERERLLWEQFDATEWLRGDELHEVVIV